MIALAPVMMSAAKMAAMARKNGAFREKIYGRAS